MLHIDQGRPAEVDSSTHVDTVYCVRTQTPAQKEARCSVLTLSESGVFYRQVHLPESMLHWHEAEYGVYTDNLNACQ